MPPVMTESAGSIAIQVVHTILSRETSVIGGNDSYLLGTLGDALKEVTSVRLLEGHVPLDPAVVTELDNPPFLVLHLRLGDTDCTQKLLPTGSSKRSALGVGTGFAYLPFADVSSGRRGYFTGVDRVALFEKVFAPRLGQASTIKVWATDHLGSEYPLTGANAGSAWFCFEITCRL